MALFDFAQYDSFGDPNLRYDISVSTYAILILKTGFDRADLNIFTL